MYALSALTALSVMKRGPETDVARTGREAPEGRVPLLAIQGASDDVVNPRHASTIARQYLARNGWDVPAGSEILLPDPDHARHESPVRGHGFRVREWEQDGELVVRLVEIDELGHAWSGGDGRVAFHEAGGPDATAMMEAYRQLAMLTWQSPEVHFHYDRWRAKLPDLERRAAEALARHHAAQEDR